MGSVLGSYEPSPGHLKQRSLSGLQDFKPSLFKRRPFHQRDLSRGRPLPTVAEASLKSSAAGMGGPDEVVGRSTFKLNLPSAQKLDALNEHFSPEQEELGHPGDLAELEENEEAQEEEEQEEQEEPEGLDEEGLNVSVLVKQMVDAES